MYCGQLTSQPWLRGVKTAAITMPPEMEHVAASPARPRRAGDLTLKTTQCTLNTLQIYPKRFQLRLETL